ncbi:MAG: DUF177 domain-containing protein [Dehalococcoidia bacterium]|nr:DUF177 domain-containing protein [Dehalococcoidia bacterium]
MKYNVAQLLKEAIGSQRQFSISEAVSDVEQLMDQVTGDATFVRTHQGIWVQADLIVRISQDCSRCLADFKRTLELELDEEYFPEVDVRTGHRLLPPDDWEGLYIGADHILDLDEATRQSALATLPMKPLCKPECEGICDRCGADRNVNDCDCYALDIDPRWAALRSLMTEPQT